MLKLTSPSDHGGDIYAQTTRQWPVPTLTAKNAYDEAVKLFNTEFTNDECKRIWLRDKHSINDVQQAVIDAKAKYDGSKQSKARKWLMRLSARISLYGVVLDVLAQHHPEYVALAWGAVKFILQGVLNQEELIKELSKALFRISQVLPEADFKSFLYPTNAMMEMLSKLYAHLIRFVQRAASWYKEGKRKHIFTAISRPYTLRFKDLVDDINDCAIQIDRLARALLMAEIRDLHIEHRTTSKSIADILRKLDEYHSLQYAGMIDTGKRVCDMQFSMILTFTANSALASPEYSRQYYASIRNRRRRQKGIDNDMFRSSQQLEDWGSKPESSLVMVKGSFKTRLVARDFAIDAIDLISNHNIPVVWALHPRRDSTKEYTSVDVLKQLVLQILQQNHSMLNERSAALNTARFQSETTEEGWFNLLGSVLAGLPQIYIVVDLEVLGQRSDNQYPWANAFAKLFDELRTRRIPCVVKVALVSYKTSRTAEVAKSIGDIINIPEKVFGKPKRVAGRGGGRSPKPIRLYAAAAAANG